VLSPLPEVAVLRPVSRTAVVVPLVLLAACSSNGSGYGGSKAPATPSATAASPGVPALTVAGFAFAPNPLTVAPGTAIPVTNRDSADHTVTSDTAGLFAADNLSQGTTVTFTAPTRPGTYTFHCAIHPSMHGALVVR
jgi:plastocyanin